MLLTEAKKVFVNAVSNNPGYLSFRHSPERI